MKRLGDITKISGRTAPVVDCVVGGSPCQDVSIAGRRAGLSGVRSGLFFEQVRVTKEMREEDQKRGRTGHLIRPRYMVWENVPGAFSSNGGKDFQVVLTEIVRIVEPSAPDVPMPRNGWPKAGCLYDPLGRWSLAWRVHDAQFWGVPQRRRRISLVMDFGGLTAPEILFERRCLSWRAESEQAPGETAGPDAGGGPVISGGALPGDIPGGGDSVDAVALRIRCGCAGGGKGPLIQEELSGTLATHNDQTIFTGLRESCGQVAVSFKAGAGAKAGGIGLQEEVSPTLAACESGTNQVPVAAVFRQHKFGDYREGIGTITSGAGTRRSGETLVVAAVDCRNGTINPETNGTLQAKPGGGQSLNYNNVVLTKPIVRRLTPLECDRLNGYPDGWTDIGPWVDSKGKFHDESKDSARYTAQGNSIALPFWKWLFKRISAQYERDATMASLFDGIGGFPLVWEQINGKGSCLWASEIEEFPIAVTKFHFGEEGAG